MRRGGGAGGATVGLSECPTSTELPAFSVGCMSSVQTVWDFRVQSSFLRNWLSQPEDLFLSAAGATRHLGASGTFLLHRGGFSWVLQLKAIV